MKEIKSETKLVISFLLGIIKTPYTLILVLLGKRSFSDVTRPFSDLIEGLLEPKFTVSIISVLVLSFIASLFLTAEVLDMLALYPSDFLGSGFYSLFTHGFLHAGIGHLLSNILIIYVFGRILENELGAEKTAVIYFFGLVFAAFFSSVINLYQGVNVGAVGASGAAMALVASGILLRPFNLSYLMIIPVPIFIIGWLAIISDVTGVLNATQDGIGYFAHIGGFISAFIMLLAVGEKENVITGIIINMILAIIFILAVMYL